MMYLGLKLDDNGIIGIAGIYNSNNPINHQFQMGGL